MDTTPPANACQRCGAPVIVNTRKGTVMHEVLDQGVLVIRRTGRHGCPAPVRWAPHP